MLPSTGYFRTISCPYFESGACERVYCHFRHKKKQTTEVNYVPTPVAELRKASLVTGSDAKSSSDLVPEYCPTPLDQLKQANYSYADSSRDRDRDSPDFECKSLLETRPIVVKHESIAAEEAKNAATEFIDTKQKTEKEAAIKTHQSHDNSGSSEPDLLQELDQMSRSKRKEQAKIDKEIEQSTRTKKKNGSGGRSVISEQEQHLNSKKSRVAHKGPDNAVRVLFRLKI
jgi:hypothetical protein